MQLLYQVDLRGEGDLGLIRDGLQDQPDTPKTRDQAFDLTVAAWGQHQEADEAVAQLAPAWPTHRQPPLDRAILRLAYYEIVSGRTPVKVAINEAVELAKRFCGELSPSFINGVLDKMVKQLAGENAAPPQETPNKVPETDTAGDVD